MDNDLRHRRAGRLTEETQATGRPPDTPREVVVGPVEPGIMPGEDHVVAAEPMDYSEVYVKPAIAEFVGVFLFVFIGAGSIIVDTQSHGALGVPGIALAHGLALALVISIFAATSGGHMNPAVTCGLLATRRIAPLKGGLYIIAQLLGATLAGLVLRIIFPTSAWHLARLGTPDLAPGTSFWLGVFLEAILTFFLVLAVFGTAVDERAPRIGGFGIGLMVLVDILVGAAITGASMNPARTFGPALAGGYWQNNLVYWIGPIIGGVLAALFYEYVILRPFSRRR